MMSPQMETKARYLAYRWYRLEDLQASHGSAWSYACANWKDFLAEAEEVLSDPPLAAVPLPDGHAARSA
jgi:hypothetical protein